MRTGRRAPGEIARPRPNTKGTTMLVWRGVGFIVLLIAAGFYFGGQFVTDRLFGAGYWSANAWPAAAALFGAGALSWFLGRRLNKPARKDAGEHRRTWTHDLFFVRMEWWAFPLAALAVAALVLNFTPGNAARGAKAAGQETVKLAPGR